MSRRMLAPIEVGLCLLSASSCLLTLAWPDWIEALSGLDPDRRSSSLEWAVAATSAATAVFFAALSRYERRRAVAAA